MEQAVHKNGDILGALRNRELAYDNRLDIGFLGAKVLHLINRTLRQDEVRVNYSEEKKERPLMLDVQNILIHETEGSLDSRMNIDTFRNTVLEVYQALCRYRLGLLPHVNPESSEERHAALVETQKYLGKYFRLKQNGSAPNFPLKALFKSNQLKKLVLHDAA